MAARPIVFLIIWSLAALPAHALTLSTKQGEAINNLVHETLECSVFYSVMDEATKADERAPMVALTYRKASHDMLVRAIDFSDLIGQRMQVLVERYNEIFDQMKNDIGDDFINAPVLRSRYLKPCQTVMDEGLARIKGILEPGQ